MSKHIHVVINPASGQPAAILNTINRVFHPAGIEWDISLTKSSGDARRYAQKAVTDGADIVAAYGGDGTVMEVSQGVMGSQVPLAILPGAMRVLVPPI
jgi:diacylglycerol kinase family enzyme